MLSDKKCPFCSSKQIEEQAESGEWWWHCYACGEEWV